MTDDRQSIVLVLLERPAASQAPATHASRSTKPSRAGSRTATGSPSCRRARRRPRRWRRAAPPRRMPSLRWRAATRAPITSRSSASSAGTADPDHLSRTFRTTIAPGSICNWPVYSGGRTDALERAAAAERQAAGEDLEAARADLRLEITRAFWALVTARETERVLARSLDSIDAHVRDLRTRLEQGLIPPNDVLSAEAQQSRQRVCAIEARNARAIAEADLRRLIGLDSAASRSIPRPRFDGRAAGARRRTPILEAQARAGGPNGARSAERAAASRAREDAARARRAAAGRRQRRVRLRAARTRASFRDAAIWQDSWDVSVNVTWLALGRRAPPRRTGRSRRGDRARGRRARRRARSPDRLRGAATMARARFEPRGDRRGGRRRPQRHRSAPRRRRTLRRRRGHEHRRARRGARRAAGRARSHARACERPPGRRAAGSRGSAGTLRRRGKASGLRRWLMC